MFPAWNMFHLIQPPPHHAVHHKLHPDQCADTYPLVQQTATLWTAPQNAPKVQQMKRKTSRWYLQMMNTGLLRETPERTLCVHEHGLKHGLCPYPCPYANYQTPSYMDSLDLSDISDYEYYMVTSSKEEIPGMEEVPYWYRTPI